MTKKPTFQLSLPGWVDCVDSALCGKLLEEDCVDVRPEHIPARITDNHVSIYRVKKLLTTAWHLIEDVVKTKIPSICTPTATETLTTLSRTGTYISCL